MTPQIGTLTLWSNPVLGIRDGIYNCMNSANVSTLGSGTQFENVTIRSALITAKIALHWEDEKSPQSFTYARFVGGGQTVYYFINSITITKNVLHIQLQVDPIATYPSMTVAGILIRGHSSQTSPLHDDYMLSYSREDSFINVTNVSNTIGNTLNPVRRFITTNVDLNNSAFQNGGKDYQLGTAIPTYAGQTLFMINTTPQGLFTRVELANTALWELNATTQQRIEVLQGLNMVQSVQHAYQLPRDVAISGTAPITQIGLSPLSTQVNIESGYSGTNQPLKRKTRVQIKQVGTGDEQINYGWEFGSASNANLVTSALLSPEGNAFSYWDNTSLMGIGFLGNMPITDRLLNHPTWNSAVLDFATPPGDMIASVQTELQRIAQEHAYDVQKSQNDLQSRQDEINALRAAMSSASSLAGLSSIIGNNKGGVWDIISGIFNGASNVGGIIADSKQTDLNKDRTEENLRLAQNGNAVAIGAINTQEQARRSVSSQRRSSPSTSLMHSAMGQSVVITVASLHNEDVLRIDRLYNAFGYNMNRYVTAIPTPRAIHNFATFSNVNVNIPDGNQLIGLLAETMLLTGVRIWRTNPTVQGIYNNF